MRQSLIGLAHLNHNDERVRRWTLNTFARIGNDENCIAAVRHILGRTPSNETQTIAAGVAAIHRVARNPNDILSPLGIDPQLQVLAALQHVLPAKLDWSSLPLKVDSASPDYLRLALLVIGLERSPQHLLDPNYDDATMVKVLGRHDDNMVSQYSVWAITESQRLGISDLGIELRDVESQPANVRGWIYQLVAMHPEAAEENWEYLIAGSKDKLSEVRGGLILGLKDVYVDGLDSIILPWVAEEEDHETRERLYDHMIRQSGKCPIYAEYVSEIYQTEPEGSPTRQRMEVSASGTSLFGRFRRIAADASGDLFGRETSVTINTFNNSGTINTGALSQGGSASSSEINIDSVRAQLALIEQAIQASALSRLTKEAALAPIAAAKSDPTPEKIKRAVDVVDGLGKVAGAGVSLAPIIMPYLEAITKALGLS